MTKTIEIPSTTTTTIYGCSHCSFTANLHETCCAHEWTVHYEPLTRKHTEPTSGADINFRYFPAVDCFKAFVNAHCVTSQEWEGQGWYREFRYMDTCRGCYTGMTTGLEHVVDTVSSRWITADVRRELEDLDVKFGDAMPEAGEVCEGTTWCRHTARVERDSIDILYAAPLNKNLDPNLVYRAWCMWMHDRD
jgi:hypothetical protein